MKKLLMGLGLVSFLIVMAVPAFPQSLRFDFDGDGAWESDWGMLPGDTAQVDVWLADYNSINDVSSVIYGFRWDPASVTVTNYWPYDTDNGGPWSPATSYAHQLEPPDEYWYKIGGPNLHTGIPVNTKIKLHRIEIQYIGGTSDIETYTVAQFLEGVSVTPAGGTELFTLSHGSALIHPPIDCEITIDPDAQSVFTGDSIQFSASESGVFCQVPCYTWEISSMGCTGGTGSTIGAGTSDNTGIYTAGEPLPGNTCNDTVQVTDPCNNDITDAAVVTVSPSPTTTTTIPTTTTTIRFGGGGGGGGFLPVTTSIIPVGDTCLTDISCNDGIYCNGEEACVFTSIENGRTYTWSSSFAGNTGSKVGACQKGDDPCPDDGEFCNGVEGCSEDNAACLSSGDPCVGGDLVCNEEKDECIEPECSEAAECDDALFCNGEETCVGGLCEAGEDPCLPDLTCDEADDRCLNGPLPEILSFSLSPQSASRSRVIGLPLIMFITSSDDVTTFDQETTTVSFSDDAIGSPPLTLVLTQKLIFVFSVIQPAGIGANGTTEVVVTVTTPEGDGTEILTMILLPLLFPLPIGGS